MAYVDRFIFRFNSVSGKSVRITIADNDYTGAAVERRLGGSPQLRCELSGNIHGMSLEIPAECKVDDEFAVLYTSDPTRFAVRLEVDSAVVWRGFVTPELYAAPWVDPPYDVQITATDGLGELKMMEWPAIGSRTLGEILETVLGATGLALPVRMISTAANDLAAAADLLTGTTVNLDHMAGKNYYDVLDGLLGSLHCTISQRGGAWLLVRETDVTSLTSGGQVSDTSGNTYPVKPFGSSQTHDCWPVGRLTTEIVPAKSTVEVECPNHLESLISDPDMELNLWQTNGSWTGEDGGYYTLDLGEYISQTASVANATRDADPGFRIKVSSRNTIPFDVGIMRLAVMATGRDPRSGSDKTLYLKEVTTQGRTQMEWVAEESHIDDGLGMPKTLDHQDCKEFVTDIFRLPTGFNPIKTITIMVSSGRNTVCVHSVNIECMSVYDKAVTRLLMDNGARGDESNSPLFADSFVGNKGNFLLSNSLRGVAGAMVRTWSSDAIPSVPYGEWLSKDMALSVATPRLRMSGRLFTVTALPALFYSNKGLSYITEEWSLDLIEDEADISLISLPAAALSTVSVSVIVEDKDGRQGAVSGGEIVSPKTGESVSSSGSIDWFVSESFEENGETKYRLKLNPKYQGMYAEGWVSAGGLSDQGGGGGGSSYLKDLLDVSLPAVSQIGLWQGLLWDGEQWVNGDVERPSNRVTSVSSASTNTQYPTAKAVYDIVNTMLSSAMRFQGVTSTALVDGATTNPVVVDGASYTATKGDVVVRSDVGLEYLWTGAKWQQLGDETSYAKKTVSITGSGYLTGGGNLEASSQIDITPEVKTKIDNGATAYASLGNYLPLSGGTINGDGTSAKTYPLRLLNPDPTGDIFMGLSNGTDNIKFGLRGPYSSYGLTLVDPSNNYYKVWHEGNDGAGSGLDADLLDGKHASDIINGVSNIIPRAWISYTDGTVADAKAKLKNIGSRDLAWMFSTASFLNEFDNDSAQLYDSHYYKILNIGAYDPNDNYSQFLCSSFGTNPLYVIGQYNGGWSKKEIAFTDSNVASATKLKTARTIWGQSFDGSADVSGNMTGVNSDNTTGIGTAIAIGCPSISGFSALGNGVSITMGISGEEYYTKIATIFEDNNPNYLQPALAFYTMYNSYQAGSEVERMRISANGNVGIGSPSQGYKLDVDGDVRASGKLYIGSTGAYFEVDSNGYLHTNFPLYSDSWVSSGGVSGTGGSGAVGYLHDLLDVDDDLNPSTGQALVWDGTEWVAGGDISGCEKTDNKVTSISSSSTDTQYPSAKAVYTVLADYLPLAGGVMTGVEKMVAGNTPRTSGSYLSFVHYSDSSEVRDADVSAKNDGFLGLYARNGIALRPGTGSAFDTAKGLSVTASDITFNDTSLINTYAKKTTTIKGSGYLTGGGNLEAARTIDIAESVKEKIDNGAAAYDSLRNYLPLAGGTMTNTKLVKNLNADLLDGKHNGDLTARTCGSLASYGSEGTTVADCKAWLAQIFSDSGTGVGDNCYVGTSYISNWGNDSATYSPSSLHSFIKIGGGYAGVNYGQWLLSSYADNRIGYVGRNANQWTDIKWLANTEDIASCAKIASPNNLMHSGNEFTFIPPNFNNGVWFNYRTSDFSSSGNVTSYYFGNGAGRYLAYITDGQFSGNAASATKLETARTIWGQNFDGTGNVDGLLTANLQAGNAGTAIQINDSIGQGCSAIRFAVDGDYEATIQYLKDVYGNPLGQHVLSLDPVSDTGSGAASAFVSLGLWTNPAMWVDCTNYRVGVGKTDPGYRLDVAGTVNIDPPEAAVPAIRIVASGNSGNHGINYVDADGNLKARFGVNSSTGLFQIFANGDVTMRSGGTSTSGFTISSPATSGNVTSYMMYPAIAGAITLNSTGAFSALGNGADLASPGTPMRSVSTKVIYLASGIYIYYDTVHNCIRTNAPIVSDSYISAGGVSTT